MKICIRHLHPGEPDWEWIWGSVLGVLAVAGGGWIALGLPTPQCLIYHWSGWPCLTCGGTRAGRALIHGNLAEAIAWNPLVTGWIILGVVYLIYAIVVRVGRLPRLRVEVVNRRVGWGIRILLVGVLATNWIYLVFRFSKIP